jgi:hypothetical protein
MSNDNAGAAGGGARSAGPNDGKAPDGKRPWSAGRIVTLVVACLLLVGSLGIGVAGGALALANKGLRDGQGFFMSAQLPLSSTGYAVTSKRVELHLEGTGRFVPDRFVGDVKFTVTPRGDAPVFIGIATAADAATYLAGVQHSVLLDFNSGSGRASDPVFGQVAGGPPSVPPGQASIWAAQASGDGKQSAVWPAEPGDWAVVVMNADGTSPVSADVAVGATFPGIGLVIGILLVIALVLFVLAIVLMVVALRTGTRRPAAPVAPAGNPG